MHMSYRKSCAHRQAEQGQEIVQWKKNMPKGTMSSILILNVLITCHSLIDLFCFTCLEISR